MRIREKVLGLPGRTCSVSAFRIEVIHDPRTQRQVHIISTYSIHASPMKIGHAYTSPIQVSHARRSCSTLAQSRLAMLAVTQSNRVYFSPCNGAFSFSETPSPLRRLPLPRNPPPTPTRMSVRS